jgi:acetyl-CoA carboxylase carboxyltransferase component
VHPLDRVRFGHGIRPHPGPPVGRAPRGDRAGVDPQEREALYDNLVAQLYERGKAINMASYLEVDAVIDPADTRKWIMQGLTSIPGECPKGTGHDFVDPW